MSFTNNLVNLSPVHGQVWGSQCSPTSDQSQGLSRTSRVSVTLDNKIPLGQLFINANSCKNIDNSPTCKIMKGVFKVRDLEGQQDIYDSPPPPYKSDTDNSIVEAIGGIIRQGPELEQQALPSTPESLVGSSSRNQRAHVANRRRTTQTGRPQPEYNMNVDMTGRPLANKNRTASEPQRASNTFCPVVTRKPEIVPSLKPMINNLPEFTKTPA